MLTINLFGQNSELKETLMSLPISRVHPFGMKKLLRKVVEVNGVAIPPIILGNGAFPLQSGMMKPHGDAVLTQEQAYFNLRLSRARMVTEGASDKLKDRFRVLHCKCESDKETVKIVGLACVVFHNLRIDKGDFLPRKFDLTFDHKTNKLRGRIELHFTLDKFKSTKLCRYWNRPWYKNSKCNCANLLGRKKQHQLSVYYFHFEANVNINVFLVSLFMIGISCCVLTFLSP